MWACYKFLCAVLITFGLVSTANAAVIFTSDAFFVPGNGPQSNGAGLFSVEQTPIGSGIPLTTPDNLGSGFATGRGFAIRYVASAADLGSSVFINWTVDRDYLSFGGFATVSIKSDFIIELTNSQGGSATVYYNAATTGSRITGAGLASITEPGDTFILTPENPTKAVSLQATSSVFELIGAGTDQLRQNYLLSLSPNHAGQEFRIYLSAGVGITSILESQQLSAVPEPSSVVALAVGFPLINRLFTRLRRTKRLH
jgi:hypothetical protein